MVISGRTVNPSMIVEDTASSSEICVSSVIAAIGLHQHPEQRLMRLRPVSLPAPVTKPTP
jgi:hypothetical protein